VKILLIEDDESVIALLLDVLTTQHYTVDVATDGQIGLELAVTWDYELILLDLLIPKLDGIHLCCKLRTQGFQKPILLLTAKGSSADVVKGLDAGADDYVTKPFALVELLARVRALLRRRTTSLAPPVLVWEKLRMNVASVEVTYAEKPLSLTPKEYGLLGLFLRNPQRAFSRSDILDRLWSIDASPSEGTVTNLIKDLRQKLKAAGMTADLLETVYGLGYRLKPPPKQDCEQDASDSTALPASAVALLTPKKIASVNKVLERYQQTFAARVSVLEQLEASLRQQNVSPALCQEAAHEAHKLAGTLGSFGYGKGSELAGAIEQLLQPNTLEPSVIPSLSALIAALKQTLTRPPTPLLVEPVESELVEPNATRLVLVIDDAAIVSQAWQAGVAWGFQVEVVALQTAQQRLNDVAPDAILLSLSTETVDQTLTLLQTIKAQMPIVPVLVMTEHDRLIDRVIVSRFGVRRFLPTSIGVPQIFEALAQMLSSAPTADANIMLVDDDSIVLESLRSHLQPWGLHVTSLQDPGQFWDVLTATKPDLLVMDLEMPTFSGIDLCRVVRQDLRWGNLPILVVTAHTDMASIQQVFAAGADDFIGKPVVGPELVTRVISRIERSRLQHELETMKRRLGT
jgi:DNA-binding response OmpR family regulator